MEPTINNVFPWGRSFNEYQQMFQLTGQDLQGRILGCADGPAAFNATMNRLGHRVISCDPLYRHNAIEIRTRIEATCEVMLALTRRDRHRFVWNSIPSPEELGRIRMAAMDDFLLDYESGREAGRYVAESLPHLSFADRSFDLALCSHFLFLYSDEVSAEDHLQSVLELCRVAGEVRIFPLLDMQSRPSRHVGHILNALREGGYHAHIERVPYEFQKGANEMMRIVQTKQRPET